ncbi:hypothetical protein PENSUB_9037 [Penicillium subrubescens]|uniref:Uncharacterized protein n=1 Tax=Penicillium subrubescens TaxID=1316194 RepID=A0A1Q5TEF4_9EURO|nr:hypothetical protein PENSUB_9037 [Penicillium subrubescens]
MYGRRRRPLLGAAVLVGASRASARHEIQRQAALDYQREMVMRQELEAQRLRDEEQEKATRRLVQEEVQRATSNNPNTASSSMDSSQPLQQLHNSPPPSYPPAYHESNIRPGDATPTNSRQVSARDNIYNNHESEASTGPEVAGKTRHCTQCGVVCQVQDRFCWKCGAKHVIQEDRK